MTDKSPIKNQTLSFGSSRASDYRGSLLLKGSGGYPLNKLTLADYRMPYLTHTLRYSYAILLT
jgi:hypothetical protein